MNQKKTLVLGASTNPGRYSHRAVLELRSQGHEVMAVGLKAGTIGDVEIITELPHNLLGINTVTLYLSAKNQKPYYELILKSDIKRLIFNPGAENAELYVKARGKGIYSINACTLVQISIGNY